MAQILLKVVVLSVALFSVNGQFPGLTSSGAGTGSGAALENMMRRLALTGGGSGSGGSGELPSSGGGLAGLSAMGASGGLAGLGTTGGLGAASAGLYGSLGGRRGRGGRGQMMRNLMLIQQFGLDNFMEYSMCQRFMPGRLSMVCMRYLY